jgi:glutathione-regulated potassium-efflux system ancillary protein KefG
MKVLVLFAHPAFEKSQTNCHLIKGLEQIDDVTLHDLYQCYPDFDIDVKKEQELLLTHDCIIFHHPMFWYSTPSILKEWQDLVLQHGWAYGKEGTALEGKYFFSCITTGGPQAAYTKRGMHQYTIEEMLLPITHTMKFCKMKVLPPFVIHGTFGMDYFEILNFRNQYHTILELISNDKFDFEQAMKMEYLNNYQKNKEY